MPLGAVRRLEDDMPTDKNFKRLIRNRAATTGESYTAARAQLLRRKVGGSKPPLVCAVIGAGGRVAYNLVFRLAAGEVFGPNQPVVLHLQDLDEVLPTLEGTAMELEDCAFPLLAGVEISSDYAASFDGASWAMLLGAPRRTAGMQRRDLLGLTAASFAEQGRALASAASDVRVLVTGNPANTNCLVARMASDLPAERWFALMRLDHNRARSQLAAGADVPVNEVRRVTVWGNHSATMVPDSWHAQIAGRPALESVSEEWMTSEFIPVVQNRGAQLIDVAGASSAASAAAAIRDEIAEISFGTPKGDWTTLGVVSAGDYGIPEGLQFGLPCRARFGRIEVIEDLDIGPAQARLLAATADELVNERDEALSLASQRP